MELEFGAYANAEGVPNNVKRNYRNAISRGNFQTAYNIISPHLPYYRRNNLANLIGQYNTHPVRAPSRYNASVVNVIRNNMAKQLINGTQNKNLITFIQPYRGGRGGIGLRYMREQVNKNPIKYAMKRTNNGKMYALALLQNNKPNQNGRYLDILTGKKGYGNKMLNKVISNARSNGRNYLALRAVVKRMSNAQVGGRRVRIPVNNHGKRNELVAYYEHKGFNTNGKFIGANNLQPMIMYFTPKATVNAKRKARETSRKRTLAAMITPRVTRARA
jgi:hypothetical protein